MISIVKNILISALSLMFLAGCAIVWGSSYNVALMNSRSVVIEYDPAIVNMTAMLGAAQSACNEYGKDAVYDSTTRGNRGIMVNTYRCEQRISDRVIDIQ